MDGRGIVNVLWGGGGGAIEECIILSLTAAHFTFVYTTLSELQDLLIATSQ